MSAPGSAPGAAPPSAEEWAAFQAWKAEERRKEMEDFERWRAQQAEGGQKPAEPAVALSVSEAKPEPERVEMLPPSYDESVAAGERGRQPAPVAAPAVPPAKTPSPSLADTLAPLAPALDPATAAGSAPRSGSRSRSPSPSRVLETTEAPCPQCKGKGKWNPNGGIIPYLAEKISPSSVLQTCPHCKGSGVERTSSYRVVPGKQIGEGARLGMVGMMGPGGMTVAPIVTTEGSRVGFVG